MCGTLAVRIEGSKPARDVCVAPRGDKIGVVYAWRRLERRATSNAAITSRIDVTIIVIIITNTVERGAVEHSAGWSAGPGRRAEVSMAPHDGGSIESGLLRRAEVCCWACWRGRMRKR